MISNKIPQYMHDKSLSIFPTLLASSNHYQLYSKSFYMQMVSRKTHPLSRIKSKQVTKG